MATLTVFNFLTLNGFFKGTNGDIGWHQHGAEEAAFSAAALQSSNTLLFGRVTYEMMVSYWPTPMAMEQNPVVAEGMKVSMCAPYARPSLFIVSKESRRRSGRNCTQMKREFI